MTSRAGNSRARRDGFTLIEMIVVMAIIAILVAILIPSIAHVKKEGRLTATEGQARLLRDAMQQYFTFYERWPGQEAAAWKDKPYVRTWSNDNDEAIAYLLPVEGVGEDGMPRNPRTKPFYTKSGVCLDAWGKPYVIQIQDDHVYVWSSNMRDRTKFQP